MGGGSEGNKIREKKKKGSGVWQLSGFRIEVGRSMLQPPLRYILM
jgi:hypothetical protein